MTVQRYDAGVLKHVQRTPQGGIRAPAALTRVGVFKYRDTAGKEWTEYRPPSEVFAADSLATLQNAPLTDLHPGSLVTAETWRTHAVGHVGEQVAPEDSFVTATVYVQDAELCKAIEAGERKEVSCGYTCDVDPTPGITPEGEPYDRSQKRIVYNHVALLPVGAGRAGPDVRLRLDGAAIQVSAALPAAISQERTMSIKLKVGGKEYRADDTGEMALAQNAIDESTRLAEASAAEVAAIRQALTEQMTKNAALEAQLGELKNKPEPTDSVLDSKVEARMRLFEDARKVLGAEADLRSKSNRTLHEMVVKTKLPDTRMDSLSDETVAGMFEALVKTARNDALSATHAAIAAPVNKMDASDRPDVEAAYRRMVERATTAWMRPTHPSSESR